MILDVIVEDKLKRLPEHKKRISEEEMTRLAIESQRVSHSFYDALAKDGLSIISEFKKASPSHGNMNNKITLEERIKQYGESADAISCLTEEDHFKGSTEYLKQIRQMTDLPIIRKDFIIDPYQVYEAKVIGADAVLLIAAIIDDSRFKELYDLAYSLGLDVVQGALSGKVGHRGKEKKGASCQCQQEDRLHIHTLTPSPFRTPVSAFPLLSAHPHRF